jgi:DNA-directed RNA polymerase subunit RPC12/RpoP
MKFSKEQIEILYKEIETSWKNNLSKFGVSLPKLKNGNGYTKDALVLVYLYKNIGKSVSKEELTSFIKQYYSNVNDVQQARHLGQQKGWFILSGTRGDIESKEYKIKAGEYMLVTLEKHYPNFTNLRRDYNETESFWEQMKKEYNYRCATCGSEEGKPNIHYPSSITKLQKGHKDPTKQLTKDNTIPQCEKCNRADRNYFIYDNKGRVIQIANPNVVLRSPIQVQLDTLKHLINKFPQKAKEFLSGILG